ncbi:VWA domain-containing protein [Desulfoscipio geothermicus]|uniref:Putative glutamine amidotransferase n=1 Tax=Desulfoscipio geothermicus DSM 3669 TaxID=1121426 RepID=A0A1I6E9Y5_9FIRM|nr:VWA domain-containing protein [Desulfoscipio geothermicus]SFR14371.1 Putative glutamine amidotransferase [Desulfoscipio geothermicus DSM 3669]
MGVSFTDPLWWLLLPVLGVLAWYLRLPWLHMPGNAVQKRRERRRFYTRLALLVLLVAALSGPGLVSVIQRQAVVMALDVSASVGPAVSEGERWVRDVLAARPPGAAVGVVSFGKRALVEEPPGTQPDFYRAAADPGKEASDVGEALRFARAILPRDARQRVVLVTDGRDTEDGAVAAARMLQAGGVRVDVVPAGVAAGSDVRLDNVDVPPRARVGENTVVEITVTADSATGAEIYLERDGELLASRPVSLRDGVNQLALSVPAGPAGLHRYRVRVMAEDCTVDAFAANNEAGGIQEVTGPPRVLVLAPSAAEARGLVSALRASGRVDVTVSGPGAAPRGLTDWARYQAVFLVNVPAYSLGERAMGELETYVRDGGGGLVMVGGPDSFGPGGYAGTPVERALPVKMDIKGRGELPSLGLILVIDKSGSMEAPAGGASKIGLAREAAARSISVLTGRDRVGVLAFDSMPWWVVPPGPVDDKEKLHRQISSIQAGGGTEIYPPLLAAYQALRDMPTQVKHIILLTDGISASGGDYQALLSDLRSAGITLSAVAVGEGADAGMLQALAELGRGRFYATADADNIPAIFTKETVMATRSFAVNQRFYPRVAASGALLRGLAEVPPLEGYITVTGKDLAETLLVSPQGDPVLAAWQYGLGRAVAWTPDAGGRWSGPWAAGDVFPRLWGNVLSWILPAHNTGSVNVETEVTSTGGDTTGQALKITVEDPGSWQEVRALRALVTGPGGSTLTVPLQPAGPGRYEARQPVEKPGAYLLSVAGGGEQPQVLARSGVVVPYPPEYRETGVDMQRLRAIARAGGGTVLEKPEQAFADNLPPVRARRDLSAGLLAVAALLWLVDVAGRRLVLGAEERAALRRSGQALRRRLRPGREREARPDWTGGTLTKVRDMRRHRGGVNGRTAPPAHSSPNGAGAGEQDGGRACATAGAGAQAPAGIGAETGFTQSAEGKSKARAAEPEQTASRLLAAKRRGFNK